MNNENRVVAAAVVVSVVLIVGLAAVLIAIGGSYLLTLHTIRAQEAAQTALRAREATAQLRAGIPTCRALQALDNASKPPVVNASTNPLSYGHKLARAIHQVYVTTRCQTLLSDLAHHMSLTEILAKLGGGD